jgi:hypothetical protein
MSAPDYSPILGQNVCLETLNFVDRLSQRTVYKVGIDFPGQFILKYK